MNILHLKYAVEVADTGSISRAAENLFMNQPNLSRAIKELEASLGITIFERTTRGMLVTPDGKEFLDSAQKILNQIDEIEERYASKKSTTQRFSISVPRASYISSAFSRFVKSIGASNPAEFYYKETDSMQTIEDVLHSDYKLGIIRYASEYDKYFKKLLEEKGLSYEMAAEFKHMLLVSRNSELAKLDEIHCDDLIPYTKLAHTEFFAPPENIKKQENIDKNNRKIYVFERASQFDLLTSCPDTYMWVSPIPKETTERFGLIQKVCADNKKIYKDVLIYRKDYKLSPLDSIFITELCNSKRRSFEN